LKGLIYSVAGLFGMCFDLAGLTDGFSPCGTEEACTTDKRDRMGLGERLDWEKKRLRWRQDW